MIQPKRSTCRRCGAPIPGKRRSFCGDTCRRKEDRAAFAQKYREDAETRRKQLARMTAYRFFPVAKPCEMCGTTEDCQRAHFSYERPTSFRWLCRRCHARWDAERRRAA